MGGGGGIGGIATTVMDPLDLTGTRAGQAQDRAMQAQQNAANQSNATQKYIFDQSRADQQPWREAGARALPQMESGDFQRDFTMADFQADPGYQFRMAEGAKALERSAAARGGLLSGGTGKALASYGQNMASEEYTNAYNRFNNDRTNRFNRLGVLAGVGQTANAQMQQAGQNYGNQVSATQIGLGNAQAASAMGRYNAQQAGIGQVVSAGAMLACDENLKTNLEQVSAEDLKELRQAIKPYKFNYANDIYGKGDWVGPMAQDLEKTKLGKMMVVTDTDGFKKIDINKFAALLLSTMAEV